MPRNKNKQRCGALTAAGAPCKGWARRDSVPPRCNHHSPGALLERSARRCAAVTASGARCRNWTLRDTRRGEGKALCQMHAGRPPVPRPAERLCVATTLDGKRCRNWPQPDEEAGGLCWLHAAPHRHPSIRHGYYRRIPYFSPPIQAELARRAHQGPPLSAELALVRLKLRGMMAYFARDDLSEAARLSASNIMFRGVKTVGRLLKAQKGLTETEWAQGSAGGAGQLLDLILEEEDGDGVNSCGE